MKITEPSAVILEPELAGLSICQRIDRCASVCYQRPPKPTEEEAQAFCRSLIERGHLPALEFAVVHLVMPWCLVVDFDGEKYLSVSWPSGDEPGVVSGSIRAFMEARSVFDVRAFLAGEIETGTFFSVPSGASHDFDSMEGIRFATPDEIPWQHKHVAVRVICSRAISHQLVRHRPCSFLQESQRYCRYDDEVTFIRPEWVSAEHFGKQPEFAGWEWEWAMETAELIYQQMLKGGLAPQQARAVLPESTKTELIMQAALPQWRHVLDLRCSAGADPEMRRVMVPLREQFQEQYPEMWEGE